MTPSLNNGIFLRDSTLPVGSHYDSYHLMDMMKNSKPTDIGVIELWAQTQQIQTPLYTFSSFGKKNVIPVNDPKGYYTWQTPIVNDMPHIVRDVDPTNVTKGVDGGTFRISLNRRAYGHGDILSYDKYAGLEFYVTADDIIDAGNNEYVYTVQLTNNSNTTYLSNAYLVPSTPIFRKSSARGEYGERFSDVSTRAGFREFYNFVGNAEAHCHYSISSRADMMMRNGVQQNGIPVREIWKVNDVDLLSDPSMVSIEAIGSRLGQTEMLKKMKDGIITKAFVTSIEQAGISKIATDVEGYLMWGLGGRVRQDGPDDIRLSTGLWKQMDTSFKRVYNIGAYIPEIIESEIYNFYNGRVDFKGPDPQRELIIQTGIAGMKQMNDAIKTMAINSGLVQNASELGAIIGKGMDLHFGYAYTSYTIPFLANVKFVINPAFDNVEANDIENPMINGYRLSSYSYIVFDITAQGNDNIFMLENSYIDPSFKWWYQNGTADYMGRSKGFVSSGQFNGYRVFMTMPHKALIVKDPTKVLKIVARNPQTGRAFGS